jgi:GNAT superfamily N-acetyltransferase
VTRLEAVAAERVRPLRAAVLRPGQAPGRLVYAGDEASDTLHLAALDGPAIVGIASVMRDGHPCERREGDWRVRGMATDPRRRRAGVGQALLAGCERHARRHGGRRIWCNARLPAQGFYERAGWRAEGDSFEVEEIGPHVVMSKRLG